MDVGRGGFSLLELLVAMTLLSVVLLLLFGGFRFGARVWERHAQGTGAAANVVSAQTLLRRHIATALPNAAAIGREQPSGSDNEDATFEGTTGGFRYLGVAPAASQMPGAYEAMVMASRSNGLHNLVLRWRLVNEARPSKPGEAIAGMSGETVLVSGALAIRFLYLDQGEQTGRPSWQEAYTAAYGLPNLVKIDVDFASSDGRQWPSFVVRPMAASY